MDGMSQVTVGASRASSASVDGAVDAAQREVRGREHDQLRVLFDVVPDDLTVKDRDGVYVDCNDAVLVRNHLSRDAVIGHTAAEAFGAAMSASLSEMDDEARRRDAPYTHIVPVAFPESPDRYVEITKVPLHTADGAFNGILSIGRDITDRLRASKEAHLAAVAFDTQGPEMVTDSDGVILRVNAAYCELVGYSATELVGRRPASFAPDDETRRFWAQVKQTLRRTGRWQGAHVIRARDGTRKKVSTTIAVVAGARGDPEYFVGSSTDLTGQTEAERQMRRMQYFDLLTDLPNRRFMNAHLRHLATSRSAVRGVLIAITVDGFPQINHLFGRETGDTVSRLVALRLRSAVRKDDIVARVDGDSFEVLARVRTRQKMSDETLAERLIERIRAKLAQPFRLGYGDPLSATFSVGWTALALVDCSPDEVSQRAEAALRRAQTGGRGQTCRFDESMKALMDRRLMITGQLLEATTNGALELYFQPQVDARGAPVGAEALLRLRQQDGTLVLPTEFIPLAEESGIIHEMGNWVLRDACARLKDWSTHERTRTLRLAVNVSAVQFAAPDFVDNVSALMTSAGIDPARLTLEITESVFLGDAQGTAERLTRLRRVGVHVSLDDFGTGYSSLAYLSRLPLDEVKIDRAFVGRLPDDERDATVARTIIAMGHGLGETVLAEGVETVAQRAFLVAHHCDLFQGYLFSEPLPLVAFDAWLRAGQG